MTTGPTTDLLRITVVTPAGVADLAIPPDLPLADLVPTLAAYGGGKLGDGPLVLQRLGESPLDQDRTAAAAGLHDGETLYLRPQDSELPSLEFDDLVDGVAGGVAGAKGRWTLRTSRRLLLGLAMVPLLVGVVLVTTAGPGATAIAVSAGTAVLLAVGAVVAAAVFGDEAVGLLIAAAALAYAATTGVLALAPDAGTASLLDGPALLAAGAAVAGLALALTPCLSASAPALAGVAVSGAGAAAGGGLLAAGVSPPRAAAAVLVAALLAGPFVPSRAAAFARLRVPPPPVGADDLQRDVAPLPGEMLLRRAALADRYLTAMSVGLAVVATAALAALATDGTAARWLAAAAAVSLLLRGRIMVSHRQRLAAVLPGVCGIALLAVRTGLAAAEPLRWAELFGLLVAAGGLAVAARTLPGRRLVPTWARAAEIVELLSALALLPLVLWVFDAYAAARAFGS